jgi:hypothetical protein
MIALACKKTRPIERRSRALKTLKTDRLTLSKIKQRIPIIAADKETL